MQNASPIPGPQVGIIAYSKFLRDMGRTDVTGWRWRKNGLLDEPKNINGRLYLTADQITRFNERVSSGEFSKEHKTPALEAAR